jgi:hypothetical protein
LEEFVIEFETALSEALRGPAYSGKLCRETTDVSSPSRKTLTLSLSSLGV